MATELETWWSQQYSMYSIQDLNSLPIFSKFVSMHYQFQRETKDHSESFKSEGAKDIFQWADNIREEGEIFSHDRSIDTWFYEHRYKEGIAQVVVRSWRAPDVEWGEIVRKYHEYSVQENWKVKEETRNYERYELRNGEKRGIKTAVLPVLEGVERWTERYWDKAGESEFEKVWERPDSKGGEIKNNKGDLWWGEQWSQAEDHNEKKTYHIQKDHEWGHSVSEACGKRVNEKWDLTKDSRTEERLTEDGGRRRGFRYVRKGADWYRQEWDGLQVIGQDEGVETLKRQQFLQEVDEVSANCHDSLLKGETTIEMLLSEAPQFAEEVAGIKKERVDIPKPDSNDIDSLLTAIRSERYLLDKQERLKQRMISETHSEHQKYYEIYALFTRLMEESHNTMKEIAIALDRNKEAQADKELWETKGKELMSRPNQASYDKAVLFLNHLTEFEQVKQAYIDRLKGGIERAEVEKAMDLLYQIMVKHDAVSDKIVELVGDEELKTKLDGFQDQFEDIHSHYQENADPDKLHENLHLLLDYQPIHLHLVGRLRGYNKGEVNNELDGIKSAVDDTKGKMSLKNARAKVRSGRPSKDTPFQLLDRSLSKLFPFMLATDAALHSHLANTHPELLSSLQNYAAKSMDSGDPFEVTVEKAAVLSEAATVLQPKAALHEEQLQGLEQDMDKVLKALIQDVYDNRPEETERNKTLLERHYVNEDASLFADKLYSLHNLSDEILELNERIDALFLDISELERIIEEKSEEITQLTVVLDERDHQVHVLTTELYEVQKYKPWFEAKDKECEILKQKLKDAHTSIAELQEKNSAMIKENHSLRELIEELEKFKLNALNLLEENKRLQGIITQYETAAEVRKSEYEFAVKRLNEEMEQIKNQLANKEDESGKRLLELVNTKAELETAKSHIADLNNEVQALKDKCAELESFKASALDFQQENEKLKAIIKSFEELIAKQKSQYDDIINNLNGKVGNLEAALKDRESALAQTTQDLGKTRADLADSQKLYADLAKEAEGLRAKCVDLESFKGSALDYQKEIERLKGIIKSYEEMMGQRTTQYDEIIANLNAKVFSQDNSLKEKDKEVEDLRAQIRALIRERRRQLTLRTALQLSGLVKGELASTFLTWKFRADLPPEVLSESVMDILPERPPAVAVEEEIWTEQQVMQYEKAETAIITFERTYLMNNSIFRMLKTDGVKFDQPMSIVSFYNLMEEIMEKKVESDNTDLLASKRPAHFSDFTLEYLLKLHGVKKVAQKDISRLIPTLYQQYHADVQLAVLLARLLHVFHASPAPLEASVVVLRLALEFKPLAESYSESRNAMNLPPLSEAQRMLTGGEAPLYEVLTAFYDRFAVDSLFIWHFLRYLKPRAVSIPDYVCAVIHWFAHTKLHLSHEKVWEVMNGEGSDTLAEAGFIQGVTVRIGLGLSTKMLKEAHKALAPSGILTRAGLDSRATALRSRNPEEFLISKGAFLIAALEAYNARLRRNAVQLRTQFEALHTDHIDSAQFGTLAKEYEADLSPECVEKLFEGGSKWSLAAPVDAVGYPAELLTNPVGSLSLDPLRVEKLGQMPDTHAFEYDLVTGSKILFQRIAVTTTTTTRRSTRSGSARRLRLNA